MFEYTVMLRILDNLSKNLFVASFSEERDQLSQWRGYCKEGGGFPSVLNIGETLPAQ